MLSTSCRPTRTRSADLFNCNEALVVSDGFTARVGSLTANAERMMPWRTIANEDDRPRLQMELETLVRGFFEPELFLDYLRHFRAVRAGRRHHHQEDCGLPPVPRRARGSACHGDRRAGRRQGLAGGARRTRHLRQGGEARLAQGGRGVAHAGLGQEHHHGLLRGQAAAAAGDEEPDAGGGDRPQRPGRPAVRHLLRGQRLAQDHAGAGGQPR